MRGFNRRKPVKKPFPEHLPRERVVGGIQRENGPPDCFLIRFTVEHQMRIAARGHGLVDVA